MPKTQPATGLLQRLGEHIEQTAIIPRGARVLVGYSGGPDSTCLLHAMHLLGFSVVGAHLHHGQRAEADEELEKCRAFCESLGIPFAAGRADVPLIAKETKVGLEEAGRAARYAFFERASTQFECDMIATAHTLDDHVETVLFNLTRGTGLRGLAGIPKRLGKVVRPLLAFTREETRAYCESESLWTHDDPANVDLSFSRARLRLRVIPELKAINPALFQTVSRAAEIVAQEDALLNAAAAAALERCETPLNGDLRFLTLYSEAAYDRKKLLHLPPVLLRRALRLAAEVFGSVLDFAQTEEVERQIRQGEKASVTLEGGVAVFETDPQIVHIRRLERLEPFRHPLAVPGETLSEEFGWRFEARAGRKTSVKPKRASLGAELAKEAVKGPLHFRGAVPGDEMRPLGFKGRRKLADLLSEARLTQAARQRLPIVCDMIGPVWAPGVCLDERARGDKASSQVLRLTFGPIG